MEIVHVNHSDRHGGAARAAYRINQALREQGLDSTMLVNVSTSGNWRVKGPDSKWGKGISIFREQLGHLLSKTLTTENPILHSPAFLPSTWPQKLNASSADLTHLHWVNGEMISIAGIGKIRKPVVWTFHDMWPFCGAEHVTEEFRWRDGYSKLNRPNYESGFDLNRWVWSRKKKHWKNPFMIVTPSQWLGDCVRKSLLAKDWRVSVIPNPINTEVWKPVDKLVARQLLQLPSDVPLLLFGALGGMKQQIKGFDLLQGALNHLRGQINCLQLVVFGQLAPKNELGLGFPVQFAGHLYDDVSLRLLYSAADVMLVPSRMEAFGQTASEAHACGTPVVAFDICGLKDIVEHQKTGYLARPFDVEDFANGIKWVLEGADRYASMCQTARMRAETQWSYPIVAQQYLDIYRHALDSQPLKAP